MAEPTEPDVHSIATAMIAKYGSRAEHYAELRVQAHRWANEPEGAELWRRSADAIRIILNGN